LNAAAMSSDDMIVDSEAFVHISPVRSEGEKEHDTMQRSR
jgi:hypothetical protein